MAECKVEHLLKTFIKYLFIIGFINLRKTGPILNCPVQ